MSRPKTMDTRIALSMPDQLIGAVDEWRRVQLDIPARSEAMRRLIELGLGANRKITKLEEDVKILRIIAREWAEKGRADQRILEAIDGDDPNNAMSSGFMRLLRQDDFIGFPRDGSEEIGRRVPPSPYPPQTPRSPKKK